MVQMPTYTVVVYMCMHVRRGQAAKMSRGSSSHLAANATWLDGMSLPVRGLSQPSLANLGDGSMCLRPVVCGPRRPCRPVQEGGGQKGEGGDQHDGPFVLIDPAVEVIVTGGGIALLEELTLKCVVSFSRYHS